MADKVDTKPTFVPEERLHPRDDSGGPDGPRYCGIFGDGGKVTKGGGNNGGKDKD